MNRHVLLLACCALPACRKEAAPPRPAAAPTEGQREGVFHAVGCGDVTAEWAGSSDELPQQDAPKSWGAESLAFRFADGALRHFRPAGQLFFSDWSFEPFSPDCAHVALLVDHYGPLHVVPVTALRAYLEGAAAPVVVTAPAQTEAAVYSAVRWRAPDALDFTATCCGSPQRLHARLGASGWEVRP